MRVFLTKQGENQATGVDLPQGATGADLIAAARLTPPAGAIFDYSGCGSPLSAAQFNGTPLQHNSVVSVAASKVTNG